FFLFVSYCVFHLLFCLFFSFVLFRLVSSFIPLFLSFFFANTTPTVIYILSLHDALPIWSDIGGRVPGHSPPGVLHRPARSAPARSEEHTSELQSRFDLVCRLLLEKKNHLQ